MSPASVFVVVTFALGYLVAAIVRGVPTWLSALYLGASALCFALYAVDKSAAIDGRERISESTLLAIGFVGGWPGAIIAQQVLRHKTSKLSFRIRFWASVGINVVLFVWVTTRMIRR